MDPSLLALLAFPGVALGLRLGAEALDRRRRQRIWSSVADARGLAFDGREIRGMLGGQAVTARVVRRAGARTLVVAGLVEPPLDLGLRIRRFEQDQWSGARLAPGYAEVHRHFELLGDEADRVQQLITPALGKLLSRNRWWDCEVNDYGFVVESVNLEGVETFLPAALDTAARVADGLARARTGVPPARSLWPHVQAWSAFAHQRGLSLLPTPLCLSGTVDGVEMLAYARRVAMARCCLEVKLRFPESLAMGLLLQPASLRDRLSIFFGADDHRLGDPVFDRTFVVRVSSPEDADRLLDADLRRDLLHHNQELGSLSVDDDGLMVRRPNLPGEPRQLLDVVRRLSALAERIATARHRRRRGPYR